MKAAILLVILSFISSTGFAESRATSRLNQLLCQTVFQSKVPQTRHPVHEHDFTLKYRAELSTKKQIEFVIHEIERVLQNKTLKAEYINRFKTIAKGTAVVFGANALYHLTIAPINTHFSYIEVGESMTFVGAAFTYFFKIRNKYADPDFLDWLGKVKEALAKDISRGIKEEIETTYTNNQGDNELTLEFYTLDGEPHLIIEVR